MFPDTCKFLTALAAMTILFPALATAQTEDRPHRIEVNGTATLYLTPDQLTLTISLVQTDPKSDKAIAAYRRTRESILSTLRTYRVGDTNITESGLAFSKVTERDYKSGNIREEYYRASTSLQLTLRDLDRYPELVVSLTEIPGVSLGSVSYNSSRAVETRHKARLQAVAEARRKAEAMAAVYGITLGPVLVMRENSPYTFQSVNLLENSVAGMGRDVADDSQLATGSEAIKITASVYVEFELKQ